MSETRSAERHDLLVGGERVQPATGEYVETVDPATGEAFAEVAVAGTSDVDAAVGAARAAFPDAIPTRTSGAAGSSASPS